MAMKVSRIKRRCRKCRKTFTSVNGHPTCQACMTRLAEEFWATMGIEMPRITAR
jgi:hypothetical protein